MELKCPCENLLPEENQWVAVAIAGDRQKHIGILYKQDDCGVMFCHHAWHYCLKNESPVKNYCWADSGLDEYNQRVVAAAFACVADENMNRISYSPIVDLEGSYFDEAWRFIKDELGAGLTCATFVMAVFKQLSFDLFDYRSWESRPDDQEWQERIIEMLMRRYAEHADEIIRKLGENTYRYRPEEVAAAVASKNIPLSFSIASQNGSELASKMLELGCLSV